MEKYITDMNVAVDAMQTSFVGFKQDILAKAKRRTEAQERLGVAEDDLHSVKNMQTDSFLESRTEHLENRARRNNLRLVGLPENTEKSQPMTEYIQQMLPVERTAL